MADNKLKRPAWLKGLMVIGFVVGGIGGAAAASELPEHVRTIMQTKEEPKEASSDE